MTPLKLVAFSLKIYQASPKSRPKYLSTRWPKSIYKLKILGVICNHLVRWCIHNQVKFLIKTVVLRLYISI